jgi:hypothetical protein
MKATQTQTVVPLGVRAHSNGQRQVLRGHHKSVPEAERCNEPQLQSRALHESSCDAQHGVAPFRRLGYGRRLAHLIPDVADKSDAGGQERSFMSDEDYPRLEC